MFKKMVSQNVLELRCPNCNYHLTDESQNKEHNEPEVRTIHFQGSEGVHMASPSEIAPTNANEES